MIVSNLVGNGLVAHYNYVAFNTEINAQRQPKVAELVCLQNVTYYASNNGSTYYAQV